MASKQGTQEDSWERAKNTWSKYVRLQDPVISNDKAFIKKEEMEDEIAKFGLADLRVVVNISEVQRAGLYPFLDIILAHEVGHHVLAPGNLITLARLNDFISGMFPRDIAGYVVNIFTDLLVNDFLFVQRGLPVDKVYKALKDSASKKGVITGDVDKFWRLYMRIYEILWRLPTGTLTTGVTPEIERDAKLSARVVRTYSKRWFMCLKNLAYIFKAYIPVGNVVLLKGLPLIDKVVAGEGGLDKLWGFASMSDDECYKPSDRQYDGELDDIFQGRRGKLQQGETNQPRLPTDYISTLVYIGAITPDDHIRALIQYYTELALPHIVPFPTIEKATGEPIHEGSEQWTIGEDVSTIDLFESIKESPVIIPGITTRKIVYGEDKGSEIEKSPVDIDIYQDTSGSMGDPACMVSYTTIAAFIIILSALRVGASVQATAWSGPNQAVSTKGFSKDSNEILRTILYYHGDGTQFPCQILERYDERKPSDPPVHIIVTSDEDISSMVSNYLVSTKSGIAETKSGYATLKKAMERGKAKGSLLLRVYTISPGLKETINKLEGLGFQMHSVSDWKNIVEWAREFSKKHFGP